MGIRLAICLYHSSSDTVFFWKDVKAMLESLDNEEAKRLLEEIKDYDDLRPACEEFPAEIVKRIHKLIAPYIFIPKR